MIYRVSLNGKVYEVEVEHGEAMIKSEFEVAAPTPQAAPAQSAPQPTPAPQAAAPSAPSGSVDAVVAPMPGNINAVKVATGQAVKKGDVLIILEAMKMENEIVAPKDGKVGQVFVQKGVSVQTGAPLVEVL